ncbi:MAG: LLM class flavin-dependent oxidoreductase [Rhodospirillales bacterium]|nr:LLM class flavin-dependent oxidoreductase [Rhodospirillales bacterium]
MRKQQMHLMAFLLAGPTCHHHGMWRHPETENAFLDPAAWEHVARVLERGCFDALFFADISSIYDAHGGGYATHLGRGGQMGLLDPLPLIAIMSRVTQHIGLGATISTSFHHAYQLARVLATLDMISNGRVAWNVVTSAATSEARNFGLTGLPDKNTRYDIAEEVLQACCALWDGWEPDALVLDKKAGIFADVDKVRYAEFEGRHVRSRGPLTVPRCPQGRPVIMQAGSSARGRDVAARWGEIVFTLQHSKHDMQVFYRDLKDRVVKAGRRPEECAILPSLDPIIGETESIARERQAYMNSLVDTELGLAVMSGHLGADFSRFPLDQPITELDLDPAVAGSMDVIVQGTKAANLTLAEAARHFATSELTPQIVGTPESVADQLQDMFESEACDGFIITPTVFPGSFEQFTRSVVPELQRRGIFRTAYPGTTLRDTLRMTP